MRRSYSLSGMNSACYRIQRRKNGHRGERQRPPLCIIPFYSNLYLQRHFLEHQHWVALIVRLNYLRVFISVSEDSVRETLLEKPDQLRQRTVIQFIADRSDSDSSAAADIHDTVRPDAAVEGFIIAEHTAVIGECGAGEELILADFPDSEDESAVLGDELSIRTGGEDTVAYLLSENGCFPDIVPVEDAAQPTGSAGLPFQYFFEHSLHRLTDQFVFNSEIADSNTSENGDIEEEDGTCDQEPG